MEQKKNSCPDCGGAPVNHFMTYVSVLCSQIVDPWTEWVSNLLPKHHRSKLAPKLIRLFTKLKLGNITVKPSTQDSWRTRVLWQEAIARGIELSEFHPFHVGSEVFIAKFGNDERYFEVLPRPDWANLDAVAWMDDKTKMKAALAKAGLPVAHGRVTAFQKRALTIFRSLKLPVIVKPNEGSQSRHTTTHITTEADLIRAFKKAKQISPWVIVEEELTGFVFRGTVVNKKLAAVIRREPAYVIGNGKASIRKLIETANENPLRNGPIFHKIAMDKNLEQELMYTHRTLDTIPQKDELVVLGQKTNRFAGGGITDMSEVVHPDNKKLLEQVAQVLDDTLVGIDIMLTDVSLSWKEQPRSGILECNSAPFIDLHHYPLVGKPRNVAGAVWDMIYPNSKASSAA